MHLHGNPSLLQQTGFEEMRNAADLDETSLPTTKSSQKYIFWLGAGVSVTAGVPAATGIVDRLLKSPASLRKLVCALTLRRGPFSQRSRPHRSAGSLFPGTYKSASSDQFRGNAEWSLANRGRVPDLRQCCSNNRPSCLWSSLVGCPRPPSISKNTGDDGRGHSWFR